MKLLKNWAYLLDWFPRKRISSSHTQVITPPPWWKAYPYPGVRYPAEPKATDRPDNRFACGHYIRLIGKPQRSRLVLAIEWHAIRREYVYIVETKNSSFTPYWFAVQLMPAAVDLVSGVTKTTAGR